jgi:hypothetical protein
MDSTQKQGLKFFLGLITSALAVPLYFSLVDGDITLRMLGYLWIIPIMFFGGHFGKILKKILGRKFLLPCIIVYCFIPIIMNATSLYLEYF